MEPPKYKIFLRYGHQRSRLAASIRSHVHKRDAVVTIRSHANGLDALGVRQVETALDKITKRENINEQEIKNRWETQRFSAWSWRGG